MVIRKRVQQKTPLIKNTPARNKLAKQKRVERTINQLKKINERLNSLGRAQGVVADAEHAQLSRKRAKLRVSLQKQFPEGDIYNIIRKHGLESALELKFRKAAEQKTKKKQKKKRPSFAGAKAILFKKSGINEKMYNHFREAYLDTHPGELKFAGREVFANRFAKTTNTTFQKTMQFVNFAQRYPKMFKVRK